MKPILSIIIPCFNSEATLDTTLESVLNQKYQNWEAVIVNDGSTDETEDIALRWVNRDGRFKYYSKQNEGLGKTRNFAINKSCATLILPLDSDNQLEENFVQDAISVFETNPNIGVVYGHAQFFGKKSGFWKVEEYKLEQILIENYIDACAIYKKGLWEQVGGYDENMPYQGLEDWELWIAFGAINVNFFHLNKITFNYYVSENSMIRSFTNEMALLSRDYIIKKYSKLYHYYLNKSISENKLLHEKMKSEKFVVNLFTKMVFGFKMFRSV
ncbi:glycosyltransferase family 2 protein [Flavobacterium sp. GT3P67]|uniref:glycosyltransferase family 2 protein n=1 Tax=Flavobacterium sp. GT3P67 TaxID=2541722 RepID=UPI0010471519|nr:glycosyltransferase [Flavobacterium sp. GT3P67]TDE53945.1 glycosyltransferase [Flavobacterium sp. GT3P67]